MDLSLLSAALGDARNAHGRLASALGATVAITVADVRSAQAASREQGSDQDDSGAQHVVKAITIRRPPTEVYQFWRNFRNFPSFMSHLDAVAVLDERTSHWTARGPAGRSVEWDAEITEDRPNELLAWQSRPGADVANAGRVRFARAPGDGGTEVRLDLWYSPPGGTLGSTVARLFGQEPRQQVQADLRKLKEVMETGEVIRSSATLAGTHVFQRPAQPAPSGSAMGARS
jgi:uncharacterized membrane protein